MPLVGRSGCPSLYLLGAGFWPIINYRIWRRRYWFWPDCGFGIFIQALCNAIRNSSRVNPARFMSPSSVHMTLQSEFFAC